MIEVRETHSFDCDEDTFWSLYADPAFQTRMLREGLGYPEVDFGEVKDADGLRTWRVRVTPRVDLPAAVARVLRGGMAYTETATVDRAKRRMTMRHETRALGKKLSLSGEIRTVARPGGGIERVARFTAAAKVLGLSGVIERSVEENFRKSMAATADYLRGVLERRA